VKRAVAAALVATLSACATAPTYRSESEEKANLASVQPAPASTDNGQAIGCTAATPCAATDGVWLPPALAAQTAGWGSGLAECKATLEKCDRVGVDTAALVIIGVLGALAGGATAVGVYELRDWLRK